MEGKGISAETLSGEQAGQRVANYEVPEEAALNPP